MFNFFCDIIESMNGEIRKKIILTADDFGISEKANENILKLVKLGKIERVSVIPHGNFSAQQIKELLELNIKIDVHLNITEDILGKRKVKEGVTKEICLFLTNIIRGKASKRKAFDRWENDLRLFLEKFGKTPDGLNSHQHIHFSSRYFKIAIKLMEKYQISFVRFGKKYLLGENNKVKNILSFLHKKNRKIFIGSKKDSTDYFVSLDWIWNVPIFLKNIPSGTVEIACHPEREEEFEIIKEYF